MYQIKIIFSIQVHCSQFGMHEKSNVYRVVWLMIIHKLDYTSGMHIQIKDQEVKGTLLVGFTWNANVDKIWRAEG